MPFVKKEVLSYKNNRNGDLIKLLDFSKGEGMVIVNEEEVLFYDKQPIYESQNLDSAEILALKIFGQLKRYFSVSTVRKFIEGWYISDFQVDLARANNEDSGLEQLSKKADNLATVAQNLFTHHPVVFNNLLKKLKIRVPSIENVSAEKTIDGRIVLQFKDGSFTDPFAINSVSDGTVKLFAYLMLLNEPNPHALLCVEEPERQLYPMLLTELLDEFRLYAEKSQVLITSHSPDLLNQMKPNEVFILIKENGFTNIKCLKDEKMITAMFNQGEKLGYLWKQGFFMN